MRKLILIIGILVLLAAAAALVVGYYRYSDVTAVQLAEVRLARLRSSVSTNGKVETEVVRELRAPFAGTCQNIRARAGQQMNSGDHILTLASPGLASELTAARAEVDAARADLETVRRGPPGEELNQAEAEVKRFRSEVEGARKVNTTNQWLLERSAISRFEVEQSGRELDRLQQQLEAATVRVKDMRARYTDQDVRRASARLEAAQARVRLVEANEARSAVRAPFHGSLLQFELKEGAYLGAGEMIGLFADLSRLRVVAFVDEPELSHIALGQEAEVRSDANPQRAWKAKVAHIQSQVVNRGSRAVVDVLCTLEGQADGLIPNLNVDVEIFTSNATEQPTLPRATVFVEGDRQFVWVIRNDRATRQSIKASRGTSDLVELDDGLKVGDKVILPGEVSLSEGMAVRAAGK